MGLFDAFKKKVAPAPAPAKAAPVQTKLTEAEAERLLLQGRAAIKLEKWEMAGPDLERAAKAGNAEAMYWLGKLCENGSYSGFNPQRAMELYLRSAEGGCLQGMQAVAEEYRYGQTENGEKAVYWYERMVAWREDDEDDDEDEVEYTESQVDAMYALAIIYTIGCGEVEPEDEKMLYWLERAAEQGEPLAMRDLGMYYRYGEEDDEIPDADKAVYWFTKGAALEDPDAALELGEMYQEGIGVEVDMKKAAQLYASAADADSEAAYRLGMLYKEGQGVVRDPEQAFKRFLDAAKRGDGDAKYELALAYGQGRGTLGDPALAYRWAKAAAEHDYVDDAAGLVAAMEKGLAGVRVPDLQALEQQAKSGDGKACYRLAFLYEAGLDVEYDADKAFNWYVKALEGGNSGAICRLARLYEAGEGIKADAAFAVKMYGEAANRGELDAAYRLGELSMASGSDENAAKMFAIAAQRDHARAQFQLAKMYIVGRGVEADQAQGLEWLRKAAENGCADARLLLEDIENQD